MARPLRIIICVLLFAALMPTDVADVGCGKVRADSPPVGKAKPRAKAKANDNLLPFLIGGAITVCLLGTGYFFLSARRREEGLPTADGTTAPWAAPGEESAGIVKPSNPLLLLVVPGATLLVTVVAVYLYFSIQEDIANTAANIDPASFSMPQPVSPPVPDFKFVPPPQPIHIPFTPPPIPRMPVVPRIPVAPPIRFR